MNRKTLFIASQKKGLSTVRRPNFESGTIWTQDNLLVLQGIDSECIDLIYLDPPFNSNKDYAARIDSKADGAEFSDRWTPKAVAKERIDLIEAKHPMLYRAIRAAQRDSDTAYLFYMALRLLEMHRILKPTGSIWLHCDPTMSHYLKIVMDAIFEKERFRNEVVWCYTGPGSPGGRQFNRKHDCLLWYSKGDRWTFNKDAVRIPYKDGKPHVGGWNMNAEEAKRYGDRGKIPETWWADIAVAIRSSKENVGYPTQKPLALLHRIIGASSNENDMVLDPFCGSATACVAADIQNRRWAGIDISPKSWEMVDERLRGRQSSCERPRYHRLDIPRRTDPTLLRR
ncbi:DNA-methyltransferase [Thioalkalivibrio sp. HK1]|uniref:DNA-methyltransferase n=1 Tax=Thioalkalivibrio sp. HK1 TaxID=1469245 RepID=UPI000470AA8F|nr:site-specific DNA-methyltransferase [Thioalkalivibrio sp. HK1]